MDKIQRVHTITMDHETLKELKHDSYMSGFRSAKVEAYDIIRYASNEKRDINKAKQLVLDLFDGDQSSIDNVIKWLDLD